MGANAISAAIGAISQIQRINFMGPQPKVGVTPMIGTNDDTKETFSLSDARMLESWAVKQPEVARISMWSMARDNGSGTADTVGPTYSGLKQANYEFSSIFKQF